MKMKKKMEILLLAGKQGVGKTTLANYINNEFGITHLELGAELKKITADLHNLPLELFFDITKKDVVLSELKKTPRELLFSVANTMRESDNLCFAKIIGDKITNGKGYVISDLGYVEELNYFKEKFGSGVCFSVWIERKVNSVFDNRTITEKDCDITIKGQSDVFNPNYMLQQIHESGKF